MGLPFNITNPGIYIPGLLTSAEANFVTDLVNQSYATGDILYYNGTQFVRLPIGTNTHVLTVSGNVPVWAAPTGGGGGGTWGSITGTLSDQTDLQAALDAKADVSHTHTTSDITNLSSYTGFDARYYTETEVNTLLSGKADTSHTHVIADVTGLQTALDGKAAVSHTHTASQITDFDTEVSNNTDVAANTAARHAAVTVTDSAEIDFTLTGQNITASIVVGSIDESKLDASVNASLDLADSASQPGHTHAVTDIVALQEYIEDLIGTKIIAGTNVTVSYNDTTGETTISSTGGGGGGGGHNYNTIYIDQSGGTSDTYGVLGGTINGTNTTFTVSQGEYATGTLKVYLNGQLQTQGTAEDWDETTPASGTFDFNVAPKAGDLITVEYQLVVVDTSTIVTTANVDELAQDAVGGILVDSAEIDFTYNDATPSITASIVAGSIDETKLDASVNASLDLADSASQPGHTHTSSNITDFQESVEDIIGTKVVAGTNVTVSYNDITGETTISSTASGSGDVVGPASSTDNALARFDSTTGKLLQDGTISASDVAAGVVELATIGNNDLILKTGNATTGSITIQDGASGNININPADGVIISTTSVNELPLTISHSSGMETYFYTGTGYFELYSNTPAGSIVDILNRDDAPYITLKNVGSSNAPSLNFDNRLSAPVDGDVIGQIYFDGSNDTAGFARYGILSVVASDVTSGTTDGKFVFNTTAAGVGDNRVVIRGSSSSGFVEASDSKNLVLQTENAFSASITIPSAANGDLFLTTNGTGAVQANGYIRNRNNSTGADGPVFEFFHESISPAANDVVGTINFYGEDSASNKTAYAAIKGIIIDPVNSSEDGKLVFSATTAGVISDVVEISGTSVSSTVDITVPDEAYGAGWNGSNEVPTKNAIYDKIETLSGGGGSAAEETSFTSNGGWITEVEAYVLAENLGYDLEAELKQYQFNGALKPLWIDVGASSEYVRVNADASFPYGYSAANQALFEKYSGRGVMPFISEALGNSGTIYNLVSNSSLRTAFITAAVADAVALGWRGIAVDIEGFGTWNATTTNHYYDFLTEFSAATKAAGKILSVYIPPIWNTAANTESGSGDEWDSANSSSYYQLTYASLNAITDVDFWEIPLYDYEFDYGSERPEAPLRWIADVVSFAKSQFDDINKLVIGVSAQGHFGADGYADFNNWTYAQASANADFGTATRNAESGELYWKPSTINYWIADDETQNIRRRLLESLGIRRMSIWYLGDNKYGSMKSVKTTNNGSLVLTRIDSPVVANADEVNIFGRNIGGRMLPAFMSPSGLDSALQPLIARNKIAWANPVGNATTLSVVGIALSATGTATSANVAVTNVHTAQRRLEYAVTTASATAVAGWRDTTAKYFLGNGFGGFTYVCRFGPSRGVAADATRRFFNGFTSVTSAPTDVNPSTIANCLGVGADSTDTNWQFMHRTGTGTVVKVDTGIPKSAADTTEAYELAMFTAPDSGVVHMEFTRMATGDVVRYAATSSLPASTTLLAPRGWTSVGGTSSVVGISLISLYIETDY